MPPTDHAHCEALARRTGSRAHHDLGQHAALRVARQPLYLDPDTARPIGFTRLRAHLAPQYARLSSAERELWLANLAFLLTPTLHSLIEKLDTIRRYRSLGTSTH